jgi:hypothetical protein
MNLRFPVDLIDGGSTHEEVDDEQVDVDRRDPEPEQH